MLNRKDKSMALCWPCGCPLYVVYCDHFQTVDFDRDDFYDRYDDLAIDRFMDDDLSDDDISESEKHLARVFWPADTFEDDPFEDDRPTMMSMRHSVKGDKCMVLDGRDRARGGWGRFLERRKEMR